MSQSWHPDDSDWRESPEGDNSMTSSCGVLERPFVELIKLPQRNSDVVAHERPHIVLACAPYDDEDEEGE